VARRPRKRPAGARGISRWSLCSVKLIGIGGGQPEGQSEPAKDSLPSCIPTSRYHISFVSAADPAGSEASSEVFGVVDR
jgi:hypothetical protein